MHPVAEVSCFVKFLDLALLLDETECNNSLHKLLRSTACSNWGNLAHSGRRNACQFRQLHLVVISCRRKEMHRTSGSNCSSNSLVKLSKRSGSGTSDRNTLRGNRRLRTHPDDVINIHIVSIKALVCSIKVDHGSEPWLVNAPEIKEVAVLTELVVIAAVICRSIDVSEENRQST